MVPPSTHNRRIRLEPDTALGVGAGLPESPAAPPYAVSLFIGRLPETAATRAKTGRSMKKLAILLAVAALSACSDSSDGQAPAGAPPSATDKGVVAAPVENTTTPKSDALPPANQSAAPSNDPADTAVVSAETVAVATARRTEIKPQYVTARDAYRQARMQLREKQAELENAVAANSPDVDRIRQETEALKVTFSEAKDEFDPLYEEWAALTKQITAYRNAQ